MQWSLQGETGSFSLQRPHREKLSDLARVAIDLTLISQQKSSQLLAQIITEELWPPYSSSTPRTRCWRNRKFRFLAFESHLLLLLVLQQLAAPGGINTPCAGCYPHPALQLLSLLLLRNKSFLKLLSFIANCPWNTCNLCRETPGLTD